MRKRRVSRGAWLPVLPTIFNENQIGVTFDIFSFFSEGLENGERIGCQAIPLVIDETITPDVASGQAGASLRDIVEGQDYVCDRIVGKINAGITTGNEAAGDLVTHAIMCAGIAVLPVADNAQETPALSIDDYDPLLADNCMAPWMWRRTWFVSTNDFGAYTPPVNWPWYPSNSAWYGDGMSGDHVDTKGVKRRITKEQRLFLVGAAYQINGSTNEELFSNALTFTYDLRLHGSLRKTHNRSTFK